MTTIPILVGSASFAATSGAVPTHDIGDLVVITAFNNASTAAPTVPTGSGYASQASGGANTCAFAVGSLIADTQAEVSGTWTNATHIMIEVWRGGALGAILQGTGASVSLAYPALTLQDTGGNSKVTAFGMHRTATDVSTQAPTGTTLATNPATSVAAFTTTAGVSSWAGETKTVNANAGWQAVSLEIKPGSFRDWLPTDAGVQPDIGIDPDVGVYSGSTLTSLANAGSEGGSFSLGATAPSKTTINGHSALTFATSGQTLGLSVGNWGAGGVKYSFSVLAMDAVDANQGVVHVGTPASLSGLTFNCGFELYVASQGFGQGPIVARSVPVLSIVAPNVLSVLVGTGQFARVDGAAIILDGDTATGTFPNILAATWVFGEGWDGGSSSLKGKLVKHYEYRTLPSAADRERLEGWGAKVANTQSALAAGHRYRLAAPLVAVTSRTGSLSVALGGFSASGSAQVATSAGLAVSLGADRLAGAGAVATSASLNASIGATVAANAANAVNGQLTAGIGSNLAGAATAALAAGFSVAVGPITVAGVGAAAVSASLTSSLGPVGLAASGAPQITATASFSLGGVVLISAAALTVSGSLGVDLGPVLLDAIASQNPVNTGSLNVGLGPATLDAHGAAGAGAQAALAIGATRLAGEGASGVQASLVVSLGSIRLSAAGGIGVFISIAPPERTLAVRGERRILAVQGENRTLRVS